MLSDIATALSASPPAVARLVAWGALLACAVSAAAVLARVAWRARLRPAERTRYADLLPFERLLADEATIAMEDGTLCRTFEVAGIDPLSSARADQALHLAARLRWIDSLAHDRDAHRISVKALTIRRRRPRPAPADAPAGLTPVHRRMVQRWYARLRDEVFETRHLVCLSVGRGSDTREALGRLSEGALRDLASYGIRTLSGRELVETWTDVVSARPAPPADAPRADPAPAGRPVRGAAPLERLADRLVAAEILFRRRSGLVEAAAGAGERRFGYAVVVAAWGPETAEELLERLTGLRHDIVVVQQVRPYPPSAAQRLVADRRRWAEWSLQTVGNSSVQQQYEAAQQGLHPDSADRLTLHRYELAVYCWGPDEAAARAAHDAVAALMRDYGFTPAIERRELPLLWWDQFPSCSQMMRSVDLLNANVAEMLAWTRAPTGHRRSAFGPSELLSYPTAAGSPYDLILHDGEGEERPGMTAILGGIGAGKSQLLAQLLMGALHNHPDLRVTVLDRDRGLHTATLALGGRYMPLNSEDARVEGARINPLLLDIRPDEGSGARAEEIRDLNRKHIAYWLRSLTGLHDPDAIAKFGDCVKDAVDTKRAERTFLKVLTTGINSNEPAFQAAARAIDEHPHIFGGDRDRIDLAPRLNVFDVRSVLDDEAVAAPVLMHLLHLHRVKCLQDLAPSMFVIDEAQTALRNDYLRDRVFEKVTTARKQLECVVCLFQFADQSGFDRTIADMVRLQFQTIVLLPNPGGRPEDIRWLMPTDREIAFYTGQYPLSRHLGWPVLVRKTGVGGLRHSVILDAHSGALGELGGFFSSSRPINELASELYMQFGPEGWTDPFLAALREIRAGRRGAAVPATPAPDTASDLPDAAE